MKNRPWRYHHTPERDYAITVKFSSYSDLQKGCELLSDIDCSIKDSSPQPSPPPTNPLTHHAFSEKITEREKEVLLLLAKGFSYAESASFLGCAISTIQTYVKRIYRKLQVNSKSEAVYEALQMGIIDL